MKNIFSSCVVFFAVLFPQIAAAVSPTPDEMAIARCWAAERFEGGKEPKNPEPFFSFLYDGKPSSELLKNWTVNRSIKKLDDKRTEHALAYADPKTGLKIDIVAIEYVDFPAIEWLMRLTNAGEKDTPILEQIRPLDLVIESHGTEGFVVHHSLGDSNSAQSFAPVNDSLSAEKPGPLVLAPNGGRSSDGHLPYFNVDWRTGGVAAAVGWSGQWEAGFDTNPAGNLRFRTGQQFTHLKLHPGESIRTPRILLVFWNGGDPLRGNNLLRQVTLAHYFPRQNGKLVFPPLCAAVSREEPDGRYDKAHAEAMKPAAERGIEVLWSDMNPQQWYPKGFPEGTGTWEPDPKRYPNGLKPVGDAAKAAGIGYLLWFEPERVHPGSKIDVEHPEFVMKSGGEWSQLFRLQDEKARKWITDYIDVQITAGQLAWVRWDFNIPPLGFWRRNDEPERQGITEIRYIEGLYAMWDDLRARHPGLMIDNCASGGRRIDLETCSRSLPLWHSDLQCEGPHPVADQLQNGGLTRWIPLHGCADFALEPSYVFRSAMTAGNILIDSLSADELEKTNSERVEAVKKTVVLYKKLRPLFLGDFHPLFPHDESEAAWYGYQLDNPEQKTGFAVVFRREQSPDAAKTIRLTGIDPAATYEIANLDTAEVAQLSGRELAEKGLQISIKDQPGSTLILYRMK